ncbi:MAG: lipopolysaccharide biosynthesis protein [bacterium]
MRRSGFPLFPRGRLSGVEIRSYSYEFYLYTAPLVVYEFAGAFISILERWLLQWFGGSAEQGFYGLSYKISAIVFMFTSALTPLLTREFAKAYGERNLGQIRYLFSRYIPMLYTIAAYLAVFVALQAGKIGTLLGGREFQPAGGAIAIMAFYPLHQTYGQLTDALFYATGRTRLYMVLGMVIMAAGLPVTWILLAPPEWLGLGWGSTGLALRMVVVQILAVNLKHRFNTRFLGLPYRSFLAHQAYSVLLLGAVGWLCVAGMDRLIAVEWLAFLTSGALYTLACAALVWRWPAFLMLTRDDLAAMGRDARARLPRPWTKWMNR